MHKSSVAGISSHVLIECKELLLDIVRPEVLIPITAPTIPLLPIVPGILQSNQLDLLIVSSSIVNHHRSDV